MGLPADATQPKKTNYFLHLYLNNCPPHCCHTLMMLVLKNFCQTQTLLTLNLSTMYIVSTTAQGCQEGGTHWTTQHIKLHCTLLVENWEAKENKPQQACDDDSLELPIVSGRLWNFFDGGSKKQIFGQKFRIYSEGLF